MQTASSLLNTVLEQARVKNYPQGQIVIYRGDPCLEVYIVKEGYIKVYDIDEAGNEKILSIVKPGDVLPYSFFSGVDVPNQWFYQTLVDTDIYVAERQTLLNAMSANNGLMIALVNNFSIEAHHLLGRLSSLGKTRTQSKILALLKYLLVSLKYDQNTRWFKVPFPINQQFIADMTGVTRESCTVAMKDLAGSGIVRIKKTNVLEINASKMSSLAE